MYKRQHIYPLFVRPRYSLEPRLCHLSAGPLGAIDFIRRFPHCSPRHAHFPPQTAVHPPSVGSISTSRLNIFAGVTLYAGSRAPSCIWCYSLQHLTKRTKLQTPRASCISAQVPSAQVLERAWRLEEERRTRTTEKPRQLLGANHGRTIFIDLSYVDHASPDGPVRVNAPYNSGHRRSPRLQERVWSGLSAS